MSSVVPAGFAAYARVLHPVCDETLSSETWVDVCAVADRQPHALMQWDSISIPHIPYGSRAVSSGVPWDGDPPSSGIWLPLRWPRCAGCWPAIPILMWTSTSACGRAGAG